MNKEKQIILFDGVCNFCNFWVNFVIKKDKKDLFRFAALQSEIAAELTDRINIDISKRDTFVLIIGEKYFIKSMAVLKVCKELNSFIVILYPFIILPEFIRDFIYDLIVNYRYKLFGKKDICRVPTDEERKKFIM